jgi:RimJ/RimL family protein N-acetyltransferase
VSIRLLRDAVLLRPFRPGEVDELFDLQRSWSADDGVHGGESLTKRQLARRLAASGTWVDGPVGLLLAIEADGRLVGEIQARGTRSQLLPPGVFELGIELYRSSDRGKGIGRAAVAEITRYLFEEEHAHRVQVSTDVDNRGMRGAAEAAGFRFEGVMRGFWPSADGRWRDYALYGTTRDDRAESDA